MICLSQLFCRDSQGLVILVYGEIRSYVFFFATSFLTDVQGPDIKVPDIYYEDYEDDGDFLAGRKGI